MWDNSVFDRAFDQAGMRQTVVRLVDGQPASKSFQARFDRPQQIVLDGEVHTTEYSIEFTTSDLQPPIEYDDVLRVEVSKGQFQDFRVKQEPLVQGDGYWTRAELGIIK
ncbi:head-tail joining protein [Alcaligenes aquatilis]|uniref:head-tail joining protein n=1 Tax=Alcaligenes aquatilis TaxID=323284 RepID=UPI0036228FBE